MWPWSRVDRLERQRGKFMTVTVARTEEAHEAIGRAETAIVQAQTGLSEMKILNKSIRAERVKNHFGSIMYDAMKPK